MPLEAPPSVDLEETILNVLEAIANVVTAAAAIWAILIARRGLDTWRDQMRASTQYELARRCLLSTLRIRQAIQGFRGPAISPGEMREAAEKAGVDPDSMDLHELLAKSDEYVYVERWRPISEAYMALRADLLEAEVVFGSEWRKAADPLERTIRKLRWGWYRFSRDKKRESSPKDSEKIDALMYDMSSDTELDDFAAQVEAAVAHLEALARPHLGHGAPARRKPRVSEDLRSERQAGPSDGGA